ncbi:NUDIX domain-containing protein [Calothrix sp. FACHB-1219]|uniref:NUDIX hydrolase n=1 Tax=unclassified Calothrix TaxID=2619626 RepID=UPI00168313CB|nr:MULTISPECIES: NUDIX domain-containing protein [unclassified Calothrix]MBD2201672.1 NUDIX domain-containing protein [Calothrix sp. FACHB-168]MBD2217358.1 NUDIX domain-containing protein [Calothrix sp. FACHB-1219]
MKTNFKPLTKAKRRLILNTRPRNLLVGAVIPNEKGKILLLKRSEEVCLPGKWEVPSGVVDPNLDISIALKEILNISTGLEINKIESRLGDTKEVSIRGFNKIQYNYLVYCKDSEVVLDKSIYSDYSWVTISHLDKYLTTTEALIFSSGLID